MHDIYVSVNPLPPDAESMIRTRQLSQSVMIDYIGATIYGVEVLGALSCEVDGRTQVVSSETQSRHWTDKSLVELLRGKTPTCAVCNHVLSPVGSYDWQCDMHCRCLMSGCVLDKEKIRNDNEA